MLLQLYILTNSDETVTLQIMPSSRRLSQSYVGAYLTNSSLILGGSFFVYLFVALMLLRSSHSQMLFKISALNFANFTGKCLCWFLFLIKLQAFNFIKKSFQHRCFPVKPAKFLRTPFLTEQLWWLFWLFFSVSSANCHSEFVNCHSMAECRNLYNASCTLIRESHYIFNCWRHLC